MDAAGRVCGGRVCDERQRASSGVQRGARQCGDHGAACEVRRGRRQRDVGILAGRRGVAGAVGVRARGVPVRAVGGGGQRGRGPARRGVAEGDLLHADELGAGPADGGGVRGHAAERAELHDDDVSGGHVRDERGAAGGRADVGAGRPHGRAGDPDAVPVAAVLGVPAELDAGRGGAAAACGDDGGCACG